ncbi:hypothetical protein BBK14_26365 [Parafrankia soli]|uniref:Uncharacterized protein n=1 Tax=Parafrankia soli TaxID=2599596 RepID=A0A1S1PJP9_9ACTN|nr:hypothetical protein [Parafrankia soli]OHV21546.1 hypothetical protein BBK14_26365 [Parafrankia soli]
MSWRDRLLLRRYGQGRSKSRATLLDREASPTDLADLRAFVAERTGVEFYVEPETTATDTTVVAVDRDGDWIRRRVGTPTVAAKLARSVGVPVYDAAVLGYPRRMRERNRNHRR